MIDVCLWCPYVLELLNFLSIGNVNSEVGAPLEAAPLEVCGRGDASRLEADVNARPRAVEGSREEEGEKRALFWLRLPARCLLEIC